MSAETLDDSSTATTEKRPGLVLTPDQPKASADESCSIASAAVPCYGTE